MRVLIAPDKYKGTATALEVAEAMAGVAASLGHEAVVQPLADGGEGTLEALGGPNRETVVTGPLGEPVTAAWRLGSSRKAIVEMARASGLSLVGGAAGNDPIAATTTGTGELIDQAIQRGARSIVVAVGGSATTDGGLGALNAMHPLERLRGIELKVACDVKTRFVDAATVFGPQKGASPAQVELLRRRLERLAQDYLNQRGVDVTELVGAGAAGGLAGGLASVGAELADGFDIVADSCALDELVAEADLVMTGEGEIDATSFDGKVVGGVASLCAEVGVPVIAISGRLDPGFESPIPLVTLVDTVGAERAMSDPINAVVSATGAAFELAATLGLPEAG